MPCSSCSGVRLITVTAMAPIQVRQSTQEESLSYRGVIPEALAPVLEGETRGIPAHLKRSCLQFTFCLFCGKIQGQFPIEFSVEKLLENTTLCHACGSDTPEAEIVVRDNSNRCKRCIWEDGPW